MPRISTDRSAEFVATKREPFHVPSNLAYYTCGALQAAVLCRLCAVRAVGARHRLSTGPSRRSDARSSSTCACVAFAAGSFVALTGISIAAKWLLIGRFEGRGDPDLEPCLFPLLGGQDPDAHLAGGRRSPARRSTTRICACWARRSAATRVISCRYVPVCADLFSIGDNTILRKDTIVLGYRAQSNFIHIGPVEIGANAFVGEASVIDIDTAMGDDTQLGHASSLQSGQRVPDGKRYHGSPAIETTSDYCPIESREGGTLRTAVFTRARARRAVPRRGAGADPRLFLLGSVRGRGRRRRSACRRCRCSASRPRSFFGSIVARACGDLRRSRASACCSSSPASPIRPSASTI